MGLFATHGLPSKDPARSSSSTTTPTTAVRRHPSSRASSRPLHPLRQFALGGDGAAERAPGFEDDVDSTGRQGECVVDSTGFPPSFSSSSPSSPPPTTRPPSTCVLWCGGFVSRSSLPLREVGRPTGYSGAMWLVAELPHCPSALPSGLLWCSVQGLCRTAGPQCEPFV